MFCSNCGAEIADGAAFCPKCGTPQAKPVETPEPANVVEAVPVQPAAPVASNEPAETVVPLIPVERAATPQPAAPVEPVAPVAPVEPVAPVAPVEPAPTYAPQQQYVPQPVNATPPTSGATTQPSYVSQPPQGSYGYQPGTPAAPTPAKKRLPIAAIVIGAIVVLAVITAIVGGCGGGGSDPEPSIDLPSDGGLSSYSSHLDLEGNPTFQAMTELSGSEFVDLIEGEGWEGNEEKLWFVPPDGNDCLYVFGPNNYEYTYDEIRSLAANGAGEPIAYVIAVDDRDYYSAENALNNITDYMVDQVEWLDDEEQTGLALITNAQGEKELLLVDYNDDPGLYVINVFNAESVEQGMVDEWLGDDYGRTPEEIWNNIFG